MQTLYPYRSSKGRWVFDDAAHGLTAEDFVEGADVLIDQVLAAKGMQDAKSFCLTFAAHEMPLFDCELSWVRKLDDGDVYRAPNGAEAWLCPALLCYFAAPPARLFVRVSATGK